MRSWTASVRRFDGFSKVRKVLRSRFEGLERSRFEGFASYTRNRRGLIPSGVSDLLPIHRPPCVSTSGSMSPACSRRARRPRRPSQRQDRRERPARQGAPPDSRRRLDRHRPAVRRKQTLVVRGVADRHIAKAEARAALRGSDAETDARGNRAAADRADVPRGGDAADDARQARSPGAAEDEGTRQPDMALVAESLASEDDVRTTPVRPRRPDDCRRKKPPILLPSPLKKLSTAFAVRSATSRGGSGTGRRHLVAVLEILDVARTAVDRQRMRHAAQLHGVDAGGTANSSAGQRRRGALHEVGPDRQRDARGVGLAADRRRLIEADPDAGDDRRREADEPGVVIVVGRAGLAADRSARRRAPAPARRCRDRRRRAACSII